MNQASEAGADDATTAVCHRDRVYRDSLCSFGGRRADCWGIGKAIGSTIFSGTQTNRQKRRELG